MKTSINNLWETDEHVSFLFLSHSGYDNDTFVWAQSLEDHSHVPLVKVGDEQPGWKKWFKDRLEGMHDPVLMTQDDYHFRLHQVRDGRLTDEQPETDETGLIRCSLSVGVGGPTMSFDYQCMDDCYTNEGFTLKAHRPQLLPEPGGLLARNCYKSSEEYEGWHLLQSKEIQTASHTHGHWLIIYRYSPKPAHTPPGHFPNHDDHLGIRDWLTYSALRKTAGLNSLKHELQEVRELLRFLTDENNDIPEYY